MTLDATAREANLRDSIKKYLVDNLTTVEGVPIIFDSSLSTPDVRGRGVDRWYKVEFGPMSRDVLSDTTLRISCCTREDNEGFKLAQLADKMMGYLTDSDGDGTRRIAFYQSSPTSAWTKIGGIVVHSIDEVGEAFGPDKTKFKILLVRLRFASKI